MKKELYKLLKDGAILYQWEVSIPEASDFGSPIPPVPPPVPIPPTPPPPTGNWGAVLATGCKLNTKNTYIGYGYHERGSPGAIGVGASGIIYFILDPNAYTGLDYTGRTIAFRAVDYDQSNTGTVADKKTKVRLITVDRNGNEISAQPLSGENNQFAGAIYYTGPSKIYIIEVKQGDLRGANISSWWP